MYSYKNAENRYFTKYSKHLSFHPSLSISHFSLWGPMKGLNENMFIRSSVIWSDLICSRSWHRWKFDVRVWSQSGQLIDWSELESSSCSFGWSFSQGLGSERLQFPSSCWIRYFGDDSVSIKTLRAGIFSILIFLVIWPPPKSFVSKSADLDDGKLGLSEMVQMGSFRADGWGGSLWAGWGGSSQADWGGFSQSTERDPNFLFSRNCWRRMAFLLFVEGEDDFFLTSVGIRAEAGVTVPLESKEQENCPLVRWKLNPIFWFTSDWMNSRHCAAKDGSWFPLTCGDAISAVESRRWCRRAHSALRVGR